MIRASLLLATAASATATLTATDFVKYYTYQGTMSVGGYVGPVTTSGTTQSGSFALTGVDSRCSATGTAANSCAIKLHAGTSCSAAQGNPYYAGTVTTDPWGSIKYDATGSGSFSVNTGGSEADVVGKTFIVYDYDGAAVACAVLGAKEEYSRLVSVPRVSKENCKNLYMIKRGMKTAKQPELSGKTIHTKVESLRSLPILNEYNCKHSYPF